MKINTSWIPHQVRNGREVVRNDNTFVILEGTPTVILEIFYRGSTVTVIPENHTIVIPNLIGDPGFFYLFSFSVIPEIFKQESMFFSL
jgi:hypothetical protein